tara:strand:- start:1256 stop:2707 length:1452 start_codon:yes stop_codon:yes gene_type:complete
MGYKDRNTLDKVGQYSLENLEIISYRQDKEESAPKVIDINAITLNFEIKEDILTNTMVGSIIVLDSQDIRTILPLTGLEKISFRYSTPGFDGYDCTEASGNPMQIYKVDNVRLEEKAGRQQYYQIFFTSEELYNNALSKVSQAFAGPTEDAVDKILRSRLYLNSKKPLFFEGSKSNAKYVIPNLPPFSAINMLARNTQSAKYNNAGYLFYENRLGFHYRSIESMLGMGGSAVRSPIWEFQTQIVPIKDTQVPSVKDIKRRMSTVINYEHKNTIDTLKNIQSGLFASKLLVHDAFNKTLTTHDFNYKEEFAKSYHTADEKGGANMLIPDTPWSDTGKALYEHSNSRLMTAKGTSKTHNNYEFPKISETLQLRLSQMASLQTMNLTLRVYGNTQVKAGDIIKFRNPMIRPVGQGKDNEENPYNSGRYLVMAVKHTVNRESDQSSTIIRCFKDCVSTPYPSEPDALIVGKEDKSKGDINNEIEIST